MLKDKLNLKLVNFLITLLVIYLIYKTSNLWMGLINKLERIIIPFFFSFIIAYILNYFITYLVNKKISKILSMIIIILTSLLISFLFLKVIIPMLIEQVIVISSSIISFIKYISNKYNIDLLYIQSNLYDILILFIKYISNNTFIFINKTFNFVSNLFIIIMLSIYFIIYMDKIKKRSKNYLIGKNINFYNYLSIISFKLNNYINGFIKIIIITFFEYYIFYTIVGHPNSLILGVIASIMNIIPYFGGVITIILALTTSYVISYKLFIGVIIISIVLSLIDSYIINPLVYKKTNKLNPILIIFGTVFFGTIFGMIGIIFSIPLTIIIIETIKYIKK